MINQQTRREVLAATVGGVVAMNLAARESAMAREENKETEKRVRRKVKFDRVNLSHIKPNSFDARTLEFFDNSISFGRSGSTTKSISPFPRLRSPSTCWVPGSAGERSTPKTRP